MLLSQIRDEDGQTRVVVRDGAEAYALRQPVTLHAFALDCLARGVGLRDGMGAVGLGPAVDPERMLAEGRLLRPISHPDPARLFVTRTGPTLAGAAAGPDLAAIHVIGPDGGPFRLGFALAGDGSGPVTGRDPESRPVPSRPVPSQGPRVGSMILGPEILIGDLPDSVAGACRVLRDGAVVREQPFLLAGVNLPRNLGDGERSAVRFTPNRQPGDVHVHILGAARSGFADGFRARPGDAFEVEARGFGLPLRRVPMTGPDAAPAPAPVAVEVM